jgi:hypothetical protein
MNITLKISAFEKILIGFILHAIGNIFAVTSKPICYSLCGIGLIIIFSQVVFAKSIYKKPFNGIIRGVFYFYLGWQFLIVVRALINEFPLSGFSPIDGYQWLSFTIPFFLFLGLSNFDIKSIFKFSYFYGLIGFVFLFFLWRDIYKPYISLGFEDYQEYIRTMGIPIYFLSICSFLVLFFKFQNRKYKYLSFVSIIIVLFTMMYAARRGGIFIFLLILLFTLFLYVFYSDKGSKFLKLIFVFAAILFFITLCFLYADSIFSLLITRLSEDSRSGVEWYFYKSFKGQTIDWIFGRGLNGTYYCPLFDNPQRDIIETGYLFLILKGGLINLTLYIFFLLNSAIKGFFRSVNILTKAMALYLFAHIIYLYPFGLPFFDFEYLIVWIFILYCQSKEWREKSDEEIKQIIFSQK